MTSVPTVRSLGDAPVSRKVVIERHPRPDDRPGLIALMRQVVEEGGVQSIMVSVALPTVRVERLLTPDRVPGPYDVSTDLLELAMLGEVRELDVQGLTRPMEVLVQALRVLDKEGLRPRALLVGSSRALWDWLQQPPSFSRRLLGMEVREASLPEDAALVLGVDPVDEDVIALTLKIYLDGMDA